MSSISPGFSPVLVLTYKNLRKTFGLAAVTLFAELDISSKAIEGMPAKVRDEQEPVNA